MKHDSLANSEKTSIQVIERMMALLDALTSYPDPVSLKELATATGLHPSTAHRILNDMVTKRFVDRSEPGTYRLGMRLLELGNIVKSRLNVREAALPYMQALHRKTQQTVNLSVRQGDEIVYIDRAFSERSGMQVVRAIGGRAPLHLTSIGKLFLSADDAKLVRAYATRTGLAGNNKNSITDLAKLERELSLVRARGYARDNEELELGVRCMAAGVRDDAGRLIAGLSISAPADRLSDDWLDDLITTTTDISSV
jgi:DNA-binding IclR family transcriptional regulator